MTVELRLRILQHSITQASLKNDFIKADYLRLERDAILIILKSNSLH